MRFGALLWVRNCVDVTVEGFVKLLVVATGVRYFAAVFLGGSSNLLLLAIPRRQIEVKMALVVSHGDVGGHPLPYQWVFQAC